MKPWDAGHYQICAKMNGFGKALSLAKWILWRVSCPPTMPIRQAVPNQFTHRLFVCHIALRAGGAQRGYGKVSMVSSCQVAVSAML